VLDGYEAASCLITYYYDKKQGLNDIKIKFARGNAVSTTSPGIIAG
jgi:hypothetical protein